MSSTNRGAKRRERDSYLTPQWCINLLADKLVDGAEFDLIVDLGAGDGRIGFTCSTTVKANDGLLFVDLVKPVGATERWVIGDLTDEKTRREVERYIAGKRVLFVSNPPFSLAEEFLKIVDEWLVDIVNARGDSEAWFLLPLNWFGSLRRADLLNRFKPSYMAVLAPRPSFTGTGTDSNEYGWFRWVSRASSEYVRSIGWYSMLVKGEGRKVKNDGQEAEKKRTGRRPRRQR